MMRRPTIAEPDTHVGFSRRTFSDAGSIPAASTNRFIVHPGTRLLFRGCDCGVVRRSACEYAGLDEVRNDELLPEVRVVAEQDLGNEDCRRHSDFDADRATAEGSVSGGE